MRKAYTYLYILLTFFLIPIVGKAQPAPNFLIMDTDGQMIDLYENYLDQDKTILIELFWEGCPPCNAFAPLLGDLYKDWGSGTMDVEFIALDVLLNENNADVIAFQNRHGHTWPGVSADGGSIGAAAPYTDGTYGTYLGTPTIIIIAPDGTVNFSPNGFNRNQAGLDQLDAALRATGAKKPTDDSAGPVFTTEPATISDISCSSTLPEQEQLFATDSCGVSVLATIDSFQEDFCNGYSVTYRWTATDSCDNSSVITRTFAVLPDSTAPVFDKQPTPIPNVNCGDPTPAPETLTASSACGTATVNFSVDNYSPDICNGNTVTYRWVATSACGKTTETSMSFIITHDRNPPVFDTQPDSLPNIRCNQTLPIPQNLTASTGCTDVNVVFSVDEFQEDLCNGYPVTYRWTATDGCGMRTVITRTFQVEPDETDIRFSDEPVALVDLACGEVFPTPQTITASKRCFGDIPVNFTIERSSNAECGRTVTYTWTASDPCGNDVVKTASFDVAAGETTVTTKTLTGGVWNPKNEGVGEVSLTFTGGTSTTVVTDANGEFTLPDLPVDASYTIRPEKNGPADEGVTTFDLVLVTKHILGETPFTEDAQLIAADANNSGGISTFDIVLIRKVILGIDDNFEKGNWRFLPEQIELASLANINNISFTAVKIGDASGASSLTAIHSEPRSKESPVSFITKDQSFSKGTIVEAILSLPIDQSVLGFQSTFSYDTEKLQLVNIENISLSNFEPTHFNATQKGQVAISWYDVQQPASGALLKLQFQAHQSGRLSELLQLSSAIATAEAYTSTSSISDLQLKFEDPHPATPLVLLYPNPVTSNFTVQTYNQEEMDIQIEILSLDGKVIQQLEYQNQREGWQTIPIEMLRTQAGMYWVKVSDKNGVRDVVKLIQQ